MPARHIIRRRQHLIVSPCIPTSAAKYKFARLEWLSLVFRGGDVTNNLHRVQVDLRHGSLKFLLCIHPEAILPQGDNGNDNGNVVIPPPP